MTQAYTSDDQLLRKLLAAAGQRPSIAQHPAVSEFDWKSPNCFTLAQLRRLRDLGDAAAKRLGAALSKLLRAEVNLDPVQVHLRYGKAAFATFETAEPYHVPLTDDNSAAAGSIVITAAAASKFVGKFLGATGESAGTARKLSPLEQELLMDVVRTISNEFSAELTAAGGKSLRIGNIGRDAPGGMDLAECGCFVMGDAGDVPLLAVIVRCGFLESVFAASGLATEVLGPQESTRRMCMHLGEAPVVASVWLGEAELSMKDVMDLASGDVLLLSMQAGQPVDLQLQSGQHVAHGLMVRKQGRYALQVTDRVEAQPTEQTQKSGKA